MQAILFDGNCGNFALPQGTIVAELGGLGGAAQLFRRRRVRDRGVGRGQPVRVAVLVLLVHALRGPPPQQEEPTLRSDRPPALDLRKVSAATTDQLSQELASTK